MAESVREKPILFSGPMVRAILAGMKTQTRRLRGLQDLNAYPGRTAGDSPLGALGYRGPLPSPLYLCDRAKKVYAREPGLFHWALGSQESEVNPIPLRCPFGSPGDRLWVKETWCTWGCGDSFVGYRATDEERLCPDTYDRWRPSIFMPRWASRLTLEVVSVRVERLGDLTEEDARAEGCTSATYRDGRGFEPATRQFRQLWEQINGAWVPETFVWVVAFERLASRPARQLALLGEQP